MTGEDCAKAGCLAVGNAAKCSKEKNCPLNLKKEKKKEKEHPYSCDCDGCNLIPQRY